MMVSRKSASFVCALLGLILVACTPTADTQPNRLTPFPRVTLTPTLTAGDPNVIITLAAAQAIATNQSAQATDQSARVTATVSAWQVSALQTQQAVAIEQTSIALVATSTTIARNDRATVAAQSYAGTPTAVAAQMTVTAGTQQASEHARQEQNNQSAARWSEIESGAWFILRTGVACLAGLFVLALTVAGVYRLFGHVRAVNAREHLEALRAGVHSSDGQIVVFDPDGGYESVIPYWSVGQPQPSQLRPAQPATSQHVPYSVGGVSQSPLPVQTPPQMDESAARAAQIILDSITIYGERGNRIAQDSDIGWPSEAWVSVTNSLYPHVVKRPGVGTYLTPNGQYKTLRALLDAIYSRAFVPSPFAVKPATEVIPSPTTGVHGRKRSKTSVEQNKTGQNNAANDEQSQLVIDAEPI